MCQLTERTDGLNARRRLRITRMPDKQGITHMFIPPRDDDRNVVSQTIGLVNKELRTLREQLAMRAQAGESFD